MILLCLCFLLFIYCFYFVLNACFGCRNSLFNWKQARDEYTQIFSYKLAAAEKYLDIFYAYEFYAYEREKVFYGKSEVCR
ncbi:hypothetical protein D3C73_801520 [compost metagenome]